MYVSYIELIKHNYNRIQKGEKRVETVDDIIKELSSKSPEWRQAFRELVEAFKPLGDVQKKEIMMEMKKILDRKEKVSGAATPETESTH